MLFKNFIEQSLQKISYLIRWARLLRVITYNNKRYFIKPIFRTISTLYCIKPYSEAFNLYSYMPNKKRAELNKYLSHKDRDIELAEAYNLQPYCICLDGFDLVIDKDVFPPDIGYTSKFLAQVLKKYKPKVALDMGCGSGYLAFVLRKIGVPYITAIDNHSPAIDCIYKNIKKNPEVMPIRVLKGDLFEPLDKEKIFDLIVFNQPFYPYTNNPIFGLGKDGGKAIINKFLSQAPKYLKEDGIILMPFSDITGEENNPKKIALSLGYHISQTWIKSDREQTHYVFEIKM